MDVKDLLKYFDGASKKEVTELKAKLRLSSNKIHSLEKENKKLQDRLYTFEGRKFGRLIQKFVRIVEKYAIVKYVVQFIYFLLYIPYGLYRIVRGKEANFRSEQSYIVREIKKIIEAINSKEIIFLIATVPWDIPLYQRPQHIALNMAKQGVLYFYLTKTKGRRKIRKIVEGCYEVFSTDHDFSFLIKIIELFKNTKKIFIKTYSTELNDVSKLLNQARAAGAKVIYEYVDEIDACISGKEIPDSVFDRFEEIVRDEKDSYVIATATKLFNDVSFYRKDKMALITNGVDYDHFSKKFNKSEVPFKFLKIYEQKKPIVSYYGALASWMDYDLLKYMAKERPQYNFVIIGVDYDGSVSSSGIEEYENIFILPPVNYKDLPRFGNFLDVCMIPFKINEITLSTSPIKLFEYMALQKPIVTTAMPECKKYESVMVAETYKEFVNYLDKAMSLREDKKYMKVLDKEAKENTWESKARETIKLIRS